MRTLGQPFDAVAREKLILDFYERVDPLDDWLDNARSFYNPNSFWVDTIDPEVIDVQWSVDGMLARRLADERFELGRLNPGRSRQLQIAVVAEDPTDWVRTHEIRSQTRITWKVTLNPGDFDGDHQITVAESIDLLTQQTLSAEPDLAFDPDLRWARRSTRPRILG